MQGGVLNMEGGELIAVSEVQYVDAVSSYLEADVLHVEVATPYVLFVKAAALFAVVEPLCTEVVASSVLAEALLVQEQEAHHSPVDRDNAQFNHFFLKVWWHIIQRGDWFPLGPCMKSLTLSVDFPPLVHY